MAEGATRVTLVLPPPTVVVEVVGGTVVEEVGGGGGSVVPVVRVRAAALAVFQWVDKYPDGVPALK